ncbi:twin-arginine translocation signal domain-containing protein [Streptomyces flavidovirens]|uniref:twin-arginine translocation signal domain-containing protein n=1 Tax=Streptomyces flavidovirens TaxID=67298 RepID=UPI0003F83077|nr:twin-arginine translocation signal domain-containing protein [Streptomyces flavidovirens]
MRRTETTRRGALAATGAAAVALLTGGCTQDSAPPGRDGSTAAAVRAEAGLRKRSARARQTLLAHYDAVVAAHPSIAGRLEPLREAVARQADALRGEGPAGRAPAPPAVAAERGAALKKLAAEEQRGTDAYTAALLEAPPELARLLASVAAAGAAHVYLLTGLLTEGSDG